MRSISISMKRVAAALLVAGAAVLASASGTVDLQLGTGDRVSGTIRPSGDTECFLLDLAKNTTVSATVTGKSKTGPAFQIVLRQNGADVPGQQFVAKKKGGKLNPVPVLADAQYQLCVLGDGAGDGDYDLTVTLKPQLSWTTPAGAELAKNADDEFRFSAPKGATATIDVLPGKGSKFKGILTAVSGPLGFVYDASDGFSRHLVTPFDLPSTGEYIVSFQNFGEQGTWSAKVKLRLKRLKVRKYDLRDGSTGGAFAGDHTVIGRLVDEGGGSVGVTTGGPIDGASVSVPEDALGSPVVITIGSGTPLAQGAGVHSAGPSVEFGPPGTTFADAKLATITIPFDPDAFPGGDTSTLVFYVRDSKGVITEVPKPYSINGNTATFQTSHFSTYQAGTGGDRQLVGTFSAVDLDLEPRPNFGAAFQIGLHRVNSSGRSANVDNDGAQIQWFNFAPGGGTEFSRQTEQQNFDVVVKADQDVQLIDLSGQAGSNITSFVRGVGDDALVAGKEGVALLRQTGGRATAATVQGAWHLFHLELDVGGSLQSQVVSFQLRSETGTVTFTADGKVALTNVRVIDSESDYPNGKWTTTAKTKPAESVATFFVGEGGVVTITPGSDPTFDLIPVLNGNVLVGREANDATADTRGLVGLYVLVRKSTGLTKAKLAGTYRFAQQSIEVVDRPQADEPPKAQDFEFDLNAFTAVIDAAGAIQVTGTSDVSMHDDTGAETTQIDKPIGTTGRVTPKSDGSLSSADLGFVGAVTPDGKFMVVLANQTDGTHEIAFGVRMP